MAEDKIERAKWLQAQIGNMQKELDSIEELLELNDKNAMTDVEKALAFDSIFDIAIEQVKYAVLHGRNMKDSYYYLYEAALVGTLGPTAFDVLNEYVE